MMLRIESDGTPHGTRLLTLDGQVIEGVQELSWSALIGEPYAEITVRIRRVALSSVGEVNEEGPHLSRVGMLSAVAPGHPYYQAPPGMEISDPPTFGASVREAVAGALDKYDDRSDGRDPF